ncbi:MAG: Spy/CpxP family protein refolding chaperone [Rhodanobacteraceae bacterium]
MRKYLIHSTLFLAVLACSPMVLAATPQQGAPSGSAAAKAQQPRQESLFDQLGLTQSQRSSVRQLMEQAMQQARPKLQTLQQKRMAFDNATPGTSQFQSAANDLANAESSATRAQVLRQADLRTKVYNLLTAEQRSKLATLMSEHERQMQQRSAAPAASH